MQLITELCRLSPEARHAVHGFTPTVPVEAMLAEVRKTFQMIGKKLPWDRYGRGNGEARQKSMMVKLGCSWKQLVIAWLGDCWLQIYGERPTDSCVGVVDPGQSW